MQQVFNRHGLSNITPVVGETKFDPNMHEALFQIPVPDKGKLDKKCLIYEISYLQFL